MKYVAIKGFNDLRTTKVATIRWGISYDPLLSCTNSEDNKMILYENQINVLGGTCFVSGEISSFKT